MNKPLNGLSGKKTTENKLKTLLKEHTKDYHPLMQWPEKEKQITRLDFSATNPDLQELNLKETDTFNSYVFGLLQQRGALFGVGGYLEKRVIYGRSNVFAGEESRSIHLGVDIWAPAFTPVFAPLAGKIHSKKDNSSFGDYGPAIILEHELEGTTFYTLYGHLSRRSLQEVEVGQQIPTGKRFTELGPYPENGDWPPHLHFQIIRDMEGRQGDFPGVAAPSDLAKYKALCPDPNLILNLVVLEAGNDTRSI